MPRPFGTDQAEALPAGRIRLRCRQAKAWTPRKPAEHGMPLHPGTAVRWEDDLWEVVAAGSTPGSGPWYDLAHWDDQHAIRVLLPYDERSESERDADARDVGRRHAAGWLTLLLAPLTGLLPGRIQERLEVELGIRAARLTVASAIIPMAAGTYALLMTLASGLGPGVQLEGPALAPLFPVLVYFLPESLLRFGVALAQDRPIGSLLGLPLYLFARATGLVGPPPTSLKSEAPAEDRRLEDRYSMLEPLLALLPVEEQGCLRDRRGFAPVTWGKRTAWLLLVYPGFTAPAQLANLVTRGGDFLSVPLLLGTLLLAVEQVWRLRKLSRGEIAPSALGHVVRPFAAPLLR
jgi:hypothetical protein